jgi:hypothetical protein
VANADPFTDTWEWVEEHPDIGVPALFIDAPMMVFIAAVTDPDTDVRVINSPVECITKEISIYC